MSLQVFPMNVYKFIYIKIHQEINLFYKWILTTSDNKRIMQNIQYLDNLKLKIKQKTY